MPCPLKIEIKFFDITNKVCAEIGVQKGDWSKEIIKCQPKHLYLIDCWEEQDHNVYTDSSNVETSIQLGLYEYVKNRFKDYKNITIIKDYSLNAVKKFNDGFFDFIYIDANHSTKTVYEDLVAWWPKIKMNGYMTGHDINNKWDSSVRPALNRFCEETSTKFIEVSRCSWAIMKDR